MPSAIPESSGALKENSESKSTYMHERKGLWHCDSWMSDSHGPVAWMAARALSLIESICLVID